MPHHVRPLELFLHAAIIAVPFVLVVLLALRAVAPSGVFTVSAGALERSPYINRLLPQERAPGADGVVSVVDEPVYFSVNVPDGYETVDVTVEYENHGQPIVELGALTDIFAQSYDLRPLENTIIDDLGWHEQNVDGVRLLQRKNDLAADDFATNPPQRYRIATYHAELPTPYREASYASLDAVQTQHVSLRGYHKFATYIRDERFAFTFGYMDMNRTEGVDDGVVRVWNEDGEVMLEEHLRDDGITSDGQDNVGMQTIAIAGDNWPEGVYEVELSGTSDIFWRTIVTPQRYVTFINRVYIGDDVGYLDGDRTTAFVTNAKHFVFETFHADSSEEVVLGGVAVQLPQSHEKVRFDVDDAGVVAGSTAKGDVKMTADGLFAFDMAAFFNPYPVTINAYTDLDALNVDYVYTAYDAPITLTDGWSQATATFTLADMYQADGAATFVLSVPGIAERDASVDVRNVTLTYRKSPPTVRDMLRQLRNLFLR